MAEERGSDAEFGEFATRSEVASMDDYCWNLPIGPVLQHASDGDGKGSGDVEVVRVKTCDLVCDGEACNQLAPEVIAIIDDALAKVGI